VDILKGDMLFKYRLHARDTSEALLQGRGALQKERARKLTRQDEVTRRARYRSSHQGTPTRLKPAALHAQFPTGRDVIRAPLKETSTGPARPHALRDRR